MAINPVNKDSLTAIQEMYKKFWTRFNYVSSNNEAFPQTFKVHTVPSIKYYQDYTVGKPYHICIKINFDKELVSIQAYFNSVIAYDEFYSLHKHKIEEQIGKCLVWKKMNKKAYAQLELTMPLRINDMVNWDKVCETILPYAILMKNVFEKF